MWSLCLHFSSHITLNETDATDDQMQNDQQYQPDQCITAVDCDTIVDDAEITVANDVPMKFDGEVTVANDMPINSDGEITVANDVPMKSDAAVDDQLNSSIDDAIRQIVTEDTDVIADMQQPVVVVYENEQDGIHLIDDGGVADAMMQTAIDDDDVNTADECLMATSIIESEQSDEGDADKYDEIGKLNIYTFMVLI